MRRHLDQRPAAGDVRAAAAEALLAVDPIPDLQQPVGAAPPDDVQVEVEPLAVDQRPGRARPSSVTHSGKPE